MSITHEHGMDELRAVSSRRPPARELSGQRQIRRDAAAGTTTGGA